MKYQATCCCLAHSCVSLTVMRCMCEGPISHCQQFQMGNWPMHTMLVPRMGLGTGKVR